MRGGAGNFNKSFCAGVKQLLSSVEYQDSKHWHSQHHGVSFGVSTVSSAFRGLWERIEQLIRSDQERGLERTPGQP